GFGSPPMKNETRYCSHAGWTRGRASVGSCFDGFNWLCSGRQGPVLYFRGLRQGWFLVRIPRTGPFPVHACARSIVAARAACANGGIVRDRGQVPCLHTLASKSRTSLRSSEGKPSAQAEYRARALPSDRNYNSTGFP